MQTSFAGKKPDISYEDYTGSEGSSSEEPTKKASLAPDPALDKLRAEAQASPDDINKVRLLANALGERVANMERAPSELVFELIGTLKAILDKEPNDKQSLITMANVSYNNQAFDQAAKYYESYLKQAPEDFESRSTYASALTFLGKSKEAEAELALALKAQPTFFPALANRAINVGLSGTKEDAYAAMNAALPHAPDPETAAKLESFIKDLTTERPKSTRGNVEKEAPVKAAAELAPSSQRFSQAADVVAQNPVAGPKFARFESNGDNLLLYMRDFPMAAMPPFAKDKFLNGVKEKIAALPTESQPKVIEFLDEGTGTLLHKLVL